MIRINSAVLFVAVLGIGMNATAVAQSTATTPPVAPVGSSISPTSAALTAANQAFARSDWDKAASDYVSVIVTDPTNGLAWQNIGESLLQLRKYDDATRAFAKAQDLKFRPLVNIVNAARAQAAKGDRTQTMLLLDQVVASGQGSRVRPVILSATEFARYSDDAQYKAMIESLTPCRATAYRQFDFWVGDWVVHDPADRVVGKNKVTLEQGGCLIVENWESAQGGQTGSSFNFYDVRDKKWHQVYIDNSGNAGAFPSMAGDLKDGRMVLMTDDKVSPVSRWTWYAVTPERVRQMAEQSTDGQKTWQVTWDSYYVRKNLSTTR